MPETRASALIWLDLSRECISFCYYNKLQIAFIWFAGSQLLEFTPQHVLAHDHQATFLRP
jgi:hypothetical protein